MVSASSSANSPGPDQAPEDLPEAQPQTLALDQARDQQAPDSPSQRPEYLAKHNIQYENHRSVDWDLLTPSMRHYAETKELNPSALLLYRMGDF